MIRIDADIIAASDEVLAKMAKLYRFAIENAQPGSEDIRNLAARETMVLTEQWTREQIALMRVG